ncbi:MAG: BolA family transcriptional regulator [Gammaproteobacteria bacterium]|nr:BolA family transcriptional regulator [Gammaproteobacteria bacterium]
MSHIDTVQEIKKRLIAALQPSSLEVLDDSAAHVGHLAADSEQGHFTIIISSAHFVTLSLVECHKLVYQALGDLLPRKIHAVKIKIKK